VSALRCWADIGERQAYTQCDQYHALVVIAMHGQ